MYLQGYTEFGSNLTLTLSNSEAEIKNGVPYMKKTCTSY